MLQEASASLLPLKRSQRSWRSKLTADESERAEYLVRVFAVQEWNAVINPLHPNANQFVLSPTQKVIWDQRLFARIST